MCGCFPNYWLHVSAPTRLHVALAFSSKLQRAKQPNWGKDVGGRGGQDSKDNRPNLGGEEEGKLDLTKPTQLYEAFL